jgi:hypothetical protein
MGKWSVTGTGTWQRLLQQRLDDENKSGQVLLVFDILLIPAAGRKGRAERSFYLHAHPLSEF